MFWETVCSWFENIRDFYLELSEFWHDNLIKVLGDEDRHVRRYASEALLKTGKPAIKPLTLALENEDEKIREGAEKVLEK